MLALNNIPSIYKRHFVNQHRGTLKRFSFFIHIILGPQNLGPNTEPVGICLNLQVRITTKETEIHKRLIYR